MVGGDFVLVTNLTEGSIVELAMTNAQENMAVGGEPIGGDMGDRGQSVGLMEKRYAEQAQLYERVRGFNYQPSYEATGYTIWRFFKPDRVKIELGLGKRYFPGMNTVRLWLSFDAFAVDPEGVERNFETVLGIANDYEMKCIPTLFNNWHSVPDFGGITNEQLGYWFRDYGKRGEADNYVFRPYLEYIVGRHKNDERILLWDLCNEPLHGGDQELTLRFLTHIYQACKQLGATQPIGVSDHMGLAQLKKIEPISDVLLIHPYGAAEENWDESIAFAKQHGKALLATECCWGSLDDATRVEIIKSDLGALTLHGIGFLAHLLHETMVCDGHRPSLGPISHAEYMAFIHMDGSLREGHGIFNQY